VKQVEIEIIGDIVYLHGDCTNFIGPETFALDINEAEELWQRLMQVCGDYRRGDIIEKVNN
jgi:hypothetical protein